MNRTPSSWPRRTAAKLLLVLASLSAGALWAHAINGAIYTSLPGGTTVNANNYALKSDVYLNGGPNNAQCSSGSLDDGQYYFQVTDPSGTTLLSSDAIGERAFTVSGGVIDTYDGTTHATAPNTGPCGGISIQLIPYADTPNSGGVYKVWVTRTSDYSPGDGNFGFVSGHTKTDNFRTRDRDGPPPPDPGGNLEAFKYYDADANGAYNPAVDLSLEGWPMTIDPLDGSPDPQTQSTNSGGTVLWTGLAPDLYTVTEGEPSESNWFNSEPGDILGPVALDGDTVTTPVQQSAVVVSGGFSRVEFGNFCLVGSGGRTLGFWSNRNGFAAMNDGGTVEPELLLLRNLNLRNANGTHFNPTSYSQFRSWLLAATAENMAYMLSAQLAAMALNVEAGFVNAGDFYIPFGGTIGDLMADADAALLADGSTPAGDPNRALQEELKDYLDELNNGALVVPAVPCAATF
jgi:hypothetical protein